MQAIQDIHTQTLTSKGIQTTITSSVESLEAVVSVWAQLNSETLMRNWRYADLSEANAKAQSKHDVIAGLLRQLEAKKGELPRLYDTLATESAERFQPGLSSEAFYAFCEWYDFRQSEIRCVTHEISLFEWAVRDLMTPNEVVA